MTPNSLHKKLRIQAGNRLLVVNAPINYIACVEPLPLGATLHFEIQGTYDVVQLFVKNKEELVYELKEVANVLKPDTVFWICYPKKSSGIDSDLNMMDSWDELDVYGLQGVAAASIDETWTALRFRPSNLIKKSEVCNSEIAQNHYSEFVNIEKRVVTLPSDLKSAMESQPGSLSAFQKLSYTNKKEYVLWILTAKQDKTRVARVDKVLRN